MHSAGAELVTGCNTHQIPRCMRTDHYSQICSCLKFIVNFCSGVNSVRSAIQDKELNGCSTASSFLIWPASKSKKKQASCQSDSFELLVCHQSGSTPDCTRETMIRLCLRTRLERT